MKRITLILLALLFTSSLSFAQNSGGIYINIGEAKLKKSLLALPPFLHLGTPNSKSRSIGIELFNTVLNDLEVSSYFQFIDQKAFLEDTSKVGLRPAPGEPGGFKFENWKTIGTDFLIRAGYSVTGKEITLEAYVYHVPQSKLIFGKKYQGPTAAARRISHTFTNDILEKLTGKKGMFLSRIVAASDRAGRGHKEIYVMDWDGENVEKITSHKSIALSPSWSRDGSTIVYTAFAFHKKMGTRNADLFTYNLINKKRYLVSSRKGINSGAVYMPDQKGFLLTISQGGNPDLYTMSSDGEGLKKLTNGPAGAMNVEPAISPDGKKIAFSSDRSGGPMIYIMNIDGTNAKRITFAGKYNSTPNWSPDGKKIVFAGQDKDHFDIFIMNTDGTNLERLTSARKKSGKWADNEEPTFSPDGRHVMFTSNRTGRNQIYIINIDGTGERRITTDEYNYFRPKWSYVNE